MGESFFDVFSTASFMPHGHCYLWNPGVLWLEVVSNGLIGLAYLGISATLGYLVWRVRDIPFRLMYLAFGVFIVTCGLTHFMDVWVIWEPRYWLDGSLRAITAVASLGTALLLPPLVPKAVAIARGARAAHQRGIQLETAVQQLATSYQRTKELDELKTQFFANVSHELRTPLTLILGPVERLLASRELSPDHARDLQLVQRNARTLLKHVNDLLDLSRIDAGKLEAHREPTDLAELVRSTAGRFEELARERSLTFDVRTPEEVAALVDSDKLQRVLLNLLSNAFKLTPEGGRIRCTLNAALAKDGERAVELSVADSGPGVPVEEREAIFERFRQVDQTPARQASGTGLGLSIAKELVELHGGTIRCTSAPEGGALFVVRLPLVVPAAPTPQPLEPVPAPAARAPAPASDAALASVYVEPLRPPTRPSAPAAASGRPTVLVIEDNPDMAQFVASTLDDRYDVITAFDGAEGLAVALERRPDAVVSDVMMPRMTGDQLIEAVRAHHELDSVPVLLLTAKADDQLRITMLQRGAQDYVMKPFAADELRARVSNLVTMKRAGDVLRGAVSAQQLDLETLSIELARKKSELETALAATEAAMNEALQASEAKTSFLRLVSHELRTPLTSIQLGVDRLRRTDETLDAKQRELVTKIARSAGRLRELVEMLLEHARLESGHLEVERTRVDLVHLASDVLEELRPRAEVKHLPLALSGPAPGEASLETDPRLVRLVLTNLVDNAVKYTEHGRVEVRVESHETSAVLAVKDTGPGIAVGDRERVFEPFEQLEEVRHKHTPGLGLGLALVRQLVRALGGRVELRSEVGVGSELVVELPRRLQGEPG